MPSIPLPKHQSTKKVAMVPLKFVVVFALTGTLTLILVAACSAVRRFLFAFTGFLAKLLVCHGPWPFS